MPIPDITGLSISELRELIEAASAAFYAAEAAEKAADVQRRGELGAAAATLEALLGPEGSQPYDPATGANATINGVLAHDTPDHAVLAQNAGLALSLILNALKVDVGAGVNAFRVLATK